MPGLNDGSNADHAYEWDITASPSGKKVTGSTEHYSIPGGRNFDWWAVDLKAGKEYTIQTRLPGTFKTNLSLYDTNGYPRLTSNHGGGDDGPNFSKITYVPTEDGTYFLQVRGYNYYNDYGDYVLECDPVPIQAAAFTIVRHASGARQVLGKKRKSTFDALRERIEINRKDTFSIRSPQIRTRKDNFDARTVQSVNRVSLFRVLRFLSSIIVGDRFSSRRGINMIQKDSFDARMFQGRDQLSLFDIRRQLMHAVISLFNIHSQQTRRSASRNYSLVKHGFSIYARNTNTGNIDYLGFVSGGSDLKELIDVPLADGSYEIEIRPSEYFWEDCRNRKVFTVTIEGGVIKTLGLPVIQNLSAKLVSAKTVVSWQVSEAIEHMPFDFGLWRSTTSPVDTSGSPDEVTPFIQGFGAYKKQIIQTEAEYVAVAAYSGSGQGEVSEIYLPWNDSTIQSPDDQFAY